eukprot:4826070-Heterocapsa_arctica.AAC.1
MPLVCGGSTRAYARDARAPESLCAGMAAERVVLNPGRRLAAALQAGGVKAMQHEQRATIREEQFHEVARSRRRIHRLRNEVVRQ